jgi:protease-3
VLDYRDSLKTNTRPEFLIVGNMSEEQAKTLAQNVRTQLGSKGEEWCRNQDVLVEKNRM